MNSIESHLNDSIMFVNDHLRATKTENERDKLSHILSEDILILDNMTVNNRKELIVAIQNVLNQLDHLFDEKKPIILLSNTCKRNCYLPENNDSLYALGNAFHTH